MLLERKSDVGGQNYPTLNPPGTNPAYSGIQSGIMNTDTIRITPELLALLSELDELKGAWRALGTLALQQRKSHLAVKVEREKTSLPREARQNPSLLRKPRHIRNKEINCRSAFERKH